MTSSEQRTESGIDLQWVDTSTRPQDDLFEHVNGTWLANHVIPDDRPLDGGFFTLRDKAEENVRDIILGCAKDTTDDADATKIGDLYASFMDTDAIEARGIDAIAPLLAAIDGAADADALAAVVGSGQLQGYGGLIGYYVDTDAHQSDRYLVHLTQSGLGLPDESYYRDEKHRDTVEAYRAHIAAMLKLADIADPAEKAQRIVELETAIAQGHWDVVRRRDAELTYNLRTSDELAAEASGFPVATWAQHLGADPSVFAETVVAQPSFLTAIGELWASTPIEQWKDWARWHVIHSAAPYLPQKFVDENFTFYGRTLSGTERIRDRWKRGVSLVEDALGFAVGKLYVAQHFPPDAKARMDELIANLIEAYRRNIGDLEWMSPETREKALVKLGKFTPKIGYPERWRDYSSLTIDAGDLIGNVQRASVFEHEREFAKIGSDVDRTEWFMTPQTVNAYYNPGMNEIVFPAAILQPPFFNADADDAANYGAIGAVIGHEIGHGFDDQGAKYDGDGNLNNWWTEEDQTEFTSRTRKLIDQYSQFTPKGLAPDHKVNGEFTIGENIGDLGGLSIAVVAYRIALEQSGTTPPVIDNLTGLQRVFYSWAQVWRTKTRDAEAIRRLSIDPHSPPEFRCNGVIRNMDTFHEAFEVSESDSLYLPEEDRVRIW